MTGLRVLRLYHSGVVDEYRERERMLRSRHGHDVRLVCPPRWSEGGQTVAAPAQSDFPVYVVPRRGRPHPILFWYAMRPLRAILREFRPEVVDVHEEPYSLATAAALRAVRAEVPDAGICVYSAQNIFKRYPPPFRQLESRALSAAAAAYPCSNEAGDVLRAKGFRGRLHILPLGVSLPPMLTRSRGPVRVGFVGRLEPYKGGHVALEAFARATQTTDAALEFVGDGRQADELRAQAGALGVAPRVTFTGAVAQDEALRRIAAFDVLLIPSLTTPSWKEQFGRVAVQAMALGTAVVASDSGSLREVVGDAGLLAREGDVPDFAAKLHRLIVDEAEREDLARRGRSRAEHLFTWERVADGCDRMYSDVLERVCS